MTIKQAIEMGLAYRYDRTAVSTVNAYIQAHGTEADRSAAFVADISDCYEVTCKEKAQVAAQIVARTKVTWN